MIKKYLFILLLCFLIGAVGCGKEEPSNDKNEDIIGEVLQLPDIVFLNTVDYEELHRADGLKYTITFCDKKGDYYISEDEYVCTLSFERLVNEYAEGKLINKISYLGSCDSDQMMKIYHKLYELSKDDCYIIYPEYSLDVLSETERWYGLYYNEEGKIQSLTIHERDASGSHSASDERANEIYSWYISAMKK